MTRPVKMGVSEVFLELLSAVETMRSILLSTA